MSQTDKPDYKPIQSLTTSMPVIALGGQIGCITLVIVLGAAFGGIWIDRLLGTKPVITLILILGAAPLSLFLTYMMAMRAIQKVNLPKPQSSKMEQINMEDETGERN
jgi:1,4-dihydroxy-2-naphthoate octaprenyltransferase